MIDLPTAEELAAAAAAFDQDWGGVDEVLYRLCREFPNHADRRSLTAKVVLIDRAYSAGLERQVIPDRGQQAITRIADFVLAHAAEVDAILAELAPLREPLDGGTMAAVVWAHGRFTDLLRDIPTRGTVPRSFGAKYLHFHQPLVPIYDSYAAANLGKLVRWDAHEIPFAQPSGADADYWDFCVRFLRLSEACQKAGLDVTVKGLDTYLWAIPEAKK